jgi:hypothetical protein
MNREAIHNEEPPSFKNIGWCPITGGVLFMILVLSYIGLMLMLCSRSIYGHLNENFFQVDWRAGGSCILCGDFLL